MRNKELKDSFLDKSTISCDKSNNVVSISKALVTIPSYIGKDKDQSKIMWLLITRGVASPRHKATMVQTVLQSPPTFTLTLEEILHFKPKFWSQTRKNLMEKSLRGEV